MKKKPDLPLRFKDFQEVISTIQEVVEKGIGLRKSLSRLKTFNSMTDVYHNLIDKADKLRRSDICAARKLFRLRSRLFKRVFELKLDEFIASITNGAGEVTVGKRTFRLLKKKDFIEFRKSAEEALRETKLKTDPIENIICQKNVGGDKFCVSVNGNTFLPSFKDAHVEKLEKSSYITRYFDKTVDNDLVRFQIWKGYLSLLRMTGGELSVWKPNKKLVLRCVGFFKCQFIVKEYFGLMWYPYVDKQFTISWDFIDNQTQYTVFSYGDSNYEKQEKWWAGKWMTDSEDMEMPRFGKKYDVKFTIKKKDKIIASGIWKAKSRKIQFII